MSAYSDWKAGAITYEQYKAECNYEERRDKYHEDQEQLRDEDDE